MYRAGGTASSTTPNGSAQTAFYAAREGSEYEGERYQAADAFEVGCGNDREGSFLDAGGACLGPASGFRRPRARPPDCMGAALETVWIPSAEVNAFPGLRVSGTVLRFAAVPAATAPATAAAVLTVCIAPPLADGSVADDLRGTCTCGDCTLAFCGPMKTCKS